MDFKSIIKLSSLLSVKFTDRLMENCIKNYFIAANYSTMNCNPGTRYMCRCYYAID